MTHIPTQPYQSRIDPSEPYRYRCPECSSVVVRRNINTDDRVSTTDHDFNCSQCAASFDRPVDAKTGERVSREAIA